MRISWRLACRRSPDFCRAPRVAQFPADPASRRNSSTCATTRHQLPVRAVPLPSPLAARRAPTTLLPLFRRRSPLRLPSSARVPRRATKRHQLPVRAVPLPSRARFLPRIARARRTHHSCLFSVVAHRCGCLLSSARCLATQSSTVKPATRISSAPTPTILPAADAVSPRASAPAPATSARAHVVAAHSGALAHGGLEHSVSRRAVVRPLVCRAVVCAAARCRVVQRA